MHVLRELRSFFGIAEGGGGGGVGEPSKDPALEEELLADTTMPTGPEVGVAEGVD